jgi:hypothetical protein
MFRRGKRRAVLMSGAALVVVATSIVIWSSVAGADPKSEPATFAVRGNFNIDNTSTLSAQSVRSSLQGTEFTGGYGRSKGKHVTIGGNDLVSGTLSAGLTPVAVESSDGSIVVYSSWHLLANPQKGVADQGLNNGQPIGIPSVRIYDDTSGKDKLQEVGAYSPALSLDGRLAYVRGDTTTVRQNENYTGKIVVGSVDGKSFVPWTNESAKYFPYAWAGSTLLAYKALPDSEVTDLYAFSGPGESRLLASEAFVIAISPDASRVLVTVGRRMVEVVRVADGAVEASLALDGEGVADYESSTTPHNLVFSGSWYGDRVVANSDVGLVVLNVSDGIRIESVFSTPGLTFGIYEPTFLDGTHLIGWADLGALPKPRTAEQEEYKNALVECDVPSETCDVSTPSPELIWQRWVNNPSR